jgi:hypothetical protein
MRNAIVLLSAAILAGAMVVGGLWAWHSAADLTLDWDVAHPDLIVWAVRSAAVAGVAGAQVILLAVVGGRLYGRSAFDMALTGTAVAVFALASVGAVVCGLAGR